uniref:Uncharacterized protein n=1 Tax=Molossus molossus TaxID=27622 RepID=A0A7J8I7W3_MOLMO|nr:hypothetical protein HJG59_010531 [Molossus molossus]
MASHTLSSHVPLWEARAAYPDRQGPRELTGWRADSAGAAVAAPDPVLSSLYPGSATRIERASEMGALVPRAALRTAHQTLAAPLYPPYPPNSPALFASLPTRARARPCLLLPFCAPQRFHTKSPNR